MIARAGTRQPGELAHPRYSVKLEAIGFGLLVPVFFVTSGMTLDICDRSARR